MPPGSIPGALSWLVVTEDAGRMGVSEYGVSLEDGSGGGSHGVANGKRDIVADGERELGVGNGHQ